VAFTETEKADIRRALGWPARFHQHDSRLEHAMLAMATLPDHETQVRELLVCVADCRTALKDSWKYLKASKVDSIQMNTLGEHIVGLRFEGRRLTGELSAILGVPRQTDIFGSGSFRSRGFGGFGYWDGANISNLL